MKILLILFFSISLLFLLPQKSFAEQSSPSAFPKPENVEYYLPYAGILPDNPLYFLKVVRDNLVGFFISDPIKKANFDLLMADKRLISASSLMDKKNYELAITTLSKSGNYFDQAVQLSQDAKKEGREVNSLIDKLITASKKHQLVIYQMAQKTKGDTKYLLELAQVRAKNFQDTLIVIKSQ